MFSRAYVINLRRRPDRLRAFLDRLDACDWPSAWPRPEVYWAIEGDKVGVPKEFTQGGGAYGCRMSHLRILQDCLMEDVPSVLVMEDDADLRPGFGLAALEFARNVPDDWEGVMLGGQHHASAVPVAGRPGVVRVQYAQRTHAYIARGRYLRGLQERWGNGTVHIDWVMKGWQQQFRVYAPERWLIGQAGGRSDIRGAEKPPEWWNDPQGDEPVLVLHAPRAVVEELRGLGFHFGNRRDDHGMDVGLPECFDAAATPEARRARLAAWVKLIQRECAGTGMVATVWHPDATAAAVCEVWSGPVWEVRAETAVDVFGRLPAAWQERIGRSSAARQKPIVLLLTPRAVMEELRGLGFHAGYWRDQASGIDNGLKRLFGEARDPEAVAAGLKAWLAELGTEADRDGKVVAVWHPDATEDLIRRAADRSIVVIQAETAEEALKQWREPKP